jgi:hypothetical protein
MEPLFLNEKGTRDYRACPGGYGIFYLTADGGVLCPGPECANGPESLGTDPDCPDDDQWRVVAQDIYWEGPPIQCDHCGKALESEYGDPEDDG